MRTPELTRLSPAAAPAVQIVPVEVVLEDPVGATVAHPQVPIRRDEVVIGRRVNARGEHVEELAVDVEDLEAAMPAVDDEQPLVLGDGDTVNGVPLVGARIIRILRRIPPVHQELAVLVELGDPRAAIAVADEERAVGQPVDVGRSIEQNASLASAFADGAEGEHELAVMGELPDDVLLVVDDPDMLLRVVRIHLDFVRAASTGVLRGQLFEVRPFVDELAVAIDDEHGMVPPPLPAALRDRLTLRIETVCVAGGVAARRIEQAVRRPRLRRRRQRQLTALRDPDAIGRFRVYRADRSPRPPVVLDAIRTVGQRLRPVGYRLVGAELVLTAPLPGRRGRRRGGFGAVRRSTAGGYGRRGRDQDRQSTYL